MTSNSVHHTWHADFEDSETGRITRVHYVGPVADGRAEVVHTAIVATSTPTFNEISWCRQSTVFSLGHSNGKMKS